MSSSELNTTLEKLSSISCYAESDPTFEFTSLVHHLNVEFLKECYKNLDRNKAVGIDRVSWLEYNENLDNNLERLVSKLKRKAFKPLPSRRVYIPKQNGGKRPLGISSIESKIVESGISRIIGSIYEADFYEFSYGFRANKSAHQALKLIGEEINYKPINHIVEADIKGFFDNVDHELLIEFLQIRIKDSSMLFLIKRFLKAGYIDNNLLIKPEKGMPQGSILSPILSNVFLHYVLDQWYETIVKSHISGYCKIVRYADDFVCLVQYKKDAEKILRALYNRFGKYKLQLHAEKTRVFSFGRYEKENALRVKRKANTFEFLGFTHYCGKTRKGKFKVGRKTSAKKFRAKVKELNVWLRKVRNQYLIKDWWQTLCLKLQGHYEYYGISENYKSIYKFYKLAIKLARKWMSRRSQRTRISWDKMKKYLFLYPLPKPRIRHSFYTLSHNV